VVQHYKIIIQDGADSDALMKVCRNVASHYRQLEIVKMYKNACVCSCGFNPGPTGVASSAPLDPILD